MPVYDPNSAGGAQQTIHPGQKLVQAVGFDRWASKAGAWMLEVSFVVLRDDANSGDEGVITRRSFALTDKAIQFWGRFCLAVGYTQPHDPEDDDVVDHIIGLRPVICTVKGREWNGETRYEPDQFRPFRGEIDPSWDDAIEQGRESYARIAAARAAKRSGGGGGNGGGGAPRKPKGGSDLDDVPF